MQVDQFDFDLPEERIALHAASPRDSARLLVADGDGGLTDVHVWGLTSYLRRADVLVLNVSKVIPAQLTGQRPPRAEGGGREPVSIDITLLKRLAPDQWTAFARPAKRVRRDDELEFGAGVSGRVTDVGGEGEIKLTFNVRGAALDRALETIGAPPLPPYIARKRAPDREDEARYQTVYARDAGSVAAPTAGLHFTSELLDEIRAKGVEIVETVLHVGPGTFLPVKTENTDDHVMHSEWGCVSADAVERITRARNNGGRAICVGTTSLRLLESAARGGELAPFEGATDLFITPGFDFRVADLLMTNFHLPRSTLFMLVSAFYGLEATRRVYAHAIDAQYRFYSYGDACLFTRQAP